MAPGWTAACAGLPWAGAAGCNPAGHPASLPGTLRAVVTHYGPGEPEAGYRGWGPGYAQEAPGGEEIAYSLVGLGEGPSGEGSPTWPGRLPRHACRTLSGARH